MAKHRDALEKALKMPVAFALEDEAGYRAGQMIKAVLPFIAPSKQVYLPFLGIALADGRGRERDRPQTNAETFSPQAQRLARLRRARGCRFLAHRNSENEWAEKRKGRRIDPFQVSPEGFHRN